MDDLWIAKCGVPLNTADELHQHIRECEECPPLAGEFHDDDTEIE